MDSIRMLKRNVQDCPMSRMIEMVLEPMFFIADIFIVYFIFRPLPIT